MLFTSSPLRSDGGGPMACAGARDVLSSAAVTRKVQPPVGLIWRGRYASWSRADSRHRREVENPHKSDSRPRGVRRSLGWGASGPGARAVLELAAGTCERLRVKKGDRLLLGT